MHFRLMGILLVSIFMLASCDYFTAYTWNYRITVEIETPEGIKKGSAVRKVVAQMQPRITPETQAVSYRVFGEAVVVDLGERGVVFSLIDWDSYKDVFYAFPGSYSTDKAKLKFYQDLESGLTAKLAKDLPGFVTFENLDDPLSVKGVSREKMYEVFGEGVRFRRITLKITNDPVTWGEIDKWLPKTFSSQIVDGWRQLSLKERQRLSGLVKFKQGNR